MANPNQARCSVCGRLYSLTREHVCPEPGPWSRDGAQAYHRAYYLAHREEQLAAEKAKRIAAAAARPPRYPKGSPEYRARAAFKAREWRAKHPGYERRYADRAKRDRDTLRLTALMAYSDGDPACVCCREMTLEFLVLDHYNGGGNQDRKASGHRGGTQQYRQLQRLGWPPGYRVLCWNCNAALGLYGACPHNPNQRVNLVRR